MNLPPAMVYTLSGSIGAGKTTIMAFAIEGLISRGIRGVHIPLAGALKVIASYGGIVKDPTDSSEIVRLQLFSGFLNRYFEIPLDKTIPSRPRVPELIEMVRAIGTQARRILEKYSIFLPEFGIHTPQEVVDELQAIQDEFIAATLIRDVDTAKRLGRLFLQKFGTEAVREGIHPAVWTSIVMALVLKIWEEAPGPIAFFVDDVRFPNEYELIRRLQNVGVKHAHLFIVRPGVDLQAYVSENSHESEKYLLELYKLADAVIVNEYTPQTLHSALGLMVELFILAHRDIIHVEDDFGEEDLKLRER